MADVDGSNVMDQPATQMPGRVFRSKQSLRIQLYAELLLADAFCVALAFAIANSVRGSMWLSPRGVNLLFLAVPIFLVVAFNRNAYGLHVLKSWPDSLRAVLGSLFVTTLVLVLLLFFAGIGVDVSRASFAVGIGLCGAFLVIERYGFQKYATARAEGSFIDEVLIIDGVPFPRERLRYVIDACAEGIEPDLSNPRMLNRLATLLRHFDRVVVAAPPERQRAWSLLLKGANLTGEIVVAEGNALGAIGFSEFHGADTLRISRGPLSVTSRAKKRALDLAISVPIMVLIGPLMLTVAILIKLDSPGPVFFRQTRVGRGNALFEILKFRSMRTESGDARGNRSTHRDDDRITRVGRLIRRTSVDELPQLLNVLRGDMSLVGPRPHALGSLAGDKLFWEVNENYWLRHALKPGITGLAQIRGYRGATHRATDLEDRLQADLEYVNGWRLWRDVTILLGTVAVIVHPNAY